MTANHIALKEIARKMLVDMGYTPDEIKEEYSIGGHDFRKSVRVDIVGLKSDKRVAIECGITSGEKIAALKMYFDEVIVLPYFTFNIEKAEYERIIRKQSEEIITLKEACQNLELKLNNSDEQDRAIYHLGEDFIELFSRITRHTHFYTHYCNQKDIEIIEDIKEKLESLKAKIVSGESYAVVS